MAKPILVVEDDQAILSTIELVLSDEGYEVVSAPHGAAAMEVIARNSPGLILLDMKMPVMDGWAFAREYRAQTGPLAPVVVVTAARDAAERAQEVGGDAYVAKPFDVETLLAVVARYLPNPSTAPAS